MKQNKRVLISILNYNSSKDTITCIGEVVNKIGSDLDLIVIDNASIDDSVSAIHSAYPKIPIIGSKKNGGYAAGHQLAVNFALKNDYDGIWILNPDLTLHPNALDSLLNAWRVYGNAVYGSISLACETDDTIVFGGAHELDGNKEISKYNCWEGQSLQATPAAQQTRKVSAIEGFSMLIPLEVIKKHGFMDHRYFMYGEETIWCYDLRKAGIPVYVVPDSIVYHRGYGSLGEESTSENPMVVYYRMRNAVYWQRKHHGMKRLDILRRKGGALAFVKFFIKYALAGAQWKSVHRKGYFENLALIHAFLNVKGKQVQ